MCLIRPGYPIRMCCSCVEFEYARNFSESESKAVGMNQGAGDIVQNRIGQDEIRFWGVNKLKIDTILPFAGVCTCVLVLVW
mmetsp:Transcript_44572/g.51418  ORF Transcript_44572/g.51418 Transcript_44572/m.51418 type:complete len:81 (-) Transcript_44572:3-245(-)